MLLLWSLLGRCPRAGPVLQAPMDMGGFILKLLESPIALSGSLLSEWVVRSYVSASCASEPLALCWWVSVQPMRNSLNSDPYPTLPLSGYNLKHVYSWPSPQGWLLSQASSSQHLYIYIYNISLLSFWRPCCFAPISFLLIVFHQDLHYFGQCPEA